MISAGHASKSSRSSAVTETSSRRRSSWFGRSPSTASKHSVATGTRSGWATHVPSKPSPASRSLSSRTARQRDPVHLRVAPGRDERGHAADRVRAALVARLHEQLGVGAHERHRHRHLHAVGQHVSGRFRNFLIAAEDVVPAAGVQAGRVVAQLVEDLVHLERGEDRLDQHRRADRAARHAERSCAMHEDVVPEPRLEVRSPASAGRSTARRRARAAPARCGRSRGRSRTGRRDGLAVDEHVPLRAGASRAGARAASRSARSGGTASSGVRSEIVRADGVVADSPGPRSTFRHVGAFASSKSAMKTRAPELSALIIILRSTGPVISTAPVLQVRRRLRDPPRVVLADLRASPGGSPAARPRRAAPAARRAAPAAPRGAAPSSRCSVATKAERLRRQDLLVAPLDRRHHLDACSHGAHGFPLDRQHQLAEMVGAPDPLERLVRLLERPYAVDRRRPRALAQHPQQRLEVARAAHRRPEQRELLPEERPHCERRLLAAGAAEDDAAPARAQAAQRVRPRRADGVDDEVDPSPSASARASSTQPSSV